MITPADEKLINESVCYAPVANGREYRYQADWTTGSQMFHVRCDDWEEFKTAVANMETLLPETNAFPNDTPGKRVATSPEKTVNVPVCKVHGTAMVLKPAGVSKSTGKPYPSFWSCPTKNADGSYCNFHPTIG